MTTLTLRQAEVSVSLCLQVLAPGAGEPNFDSLVADPFQASRARREMEVHQLLQKLQPDMIVLDPSTIGQARPLCGPCRRLDRCPFFA